MNRRNLIKGIAATAALPFTAVDASFMDDAANRCLFGFQREMLQDYLTYDYNLFILPRGAGKTFMADHIWFNKWFLNDKNLVYNQTHYDGGHVHYRYLDDKVQEIIVDNAGLRYLQGFRWEYPRFDVIEDNFGRFKLIGTLTKGATCHRFQNTVPKLTIFATIERETNDWLRNAWMLNENWNKRRFPLAEIIKDDPEILECYKFPEYPESRDIKNFGVHRRLTEEESDLIWQREAFDMDCRFQFVGGSDNYRYV